MSIPTGKQDLVGNLVTSATSEIDIAVGSTVTNSNSLTGNPIYVPATCTNVVLVKMSSGGYTVEVSVHTTADNADFGSPTATATVLAPFSTNTLAVLANTSSSARYVSIKITNNSGITLTVVGLAMLPLGKIAENQRISGNENALCWLDSDSTGGTGDATFVLTA